MGKFNKKPAGQVVVEKGDNSKKIVSDQGGAAYTYKSMMGLYSILTTQKFDKDTFYRSTTQMEKDLVNAVNRCVEHHGAEFTAKLIVYARSEDGHRTSSHIAAVALMKAIGGKKFAKMFFSKRDRKKKQGGVVFRLDDMYEIFAAYLYTNAREKGKNPDKDPKAFEGISVPNSMKKGFKKALESADWYELAKYKAQSGFISLVDMINLCRPEPSKSRAWKTMTLNEFKESMEKARTARNTKNIDNKIKEAVESSTDGVNVRVSAFTAAVYGFLKEENTSESMNSEAGQKVAAAVKAGEITKEEAEIKIAVDKKENWKELLETRKLGYLALLRNLRNIRKVAIESNDPQVVKLACEMLIDEKMIQSPSNLIWPYQIEQARDVLIDESDDQFSRALVLHLDKAYELACPNLVNLGFFGRNAVIVDTSGSMGNYQHNAKGSRSPLTIAALIAGTLAKGTNADLYQYADKTKKIKYSIANSPFDIAKTVGSHSGEVGYGTNVPSVFGDSNGYSSYSNEPIPASDRVFIISDMNNGGSNVYRAYKNWCTKHGLHNTYVYLINVNSYGMTVMPDSNDRHIINVSGYSIDMLERIIKNELNPNSLFNDINEVNLEPTGSW